MKFLFEVSMVVHSNDEGNKNYNLEKNFLYSIFFSILSNMSFQFLSKNLEDDADMHKQDLEKHLLFMNSKKMVL